MSSDFDDIPGQRSIQQQLATAAAVVAELADDYRARAYRDLDEIARALAALRDDPAHADGPLSRVFNLAHDVKGQAGTFGYPHLTMVADALCALVQPLAGVGEAELRAIERHLALMRRILDDGLTGSDEAQARRLLKWLASPA
ncbi:MAG: Hpt domain-containing protein [Alphaproteobacteria bacterium]|nr:Hpt domain-containing protein [Alphaproteobacteria bacterium]MDP6813877.1 Hpt domain-containing protein [Alphaproteobacteria bacterium]